MAFFKHAHMAILATAVVVVVARVSSEQPVCKTTGATQTSEGYPVPNPSMECVFPFKMDGNEFTKCIDSGSFSFCGTQFDVTKLDGWGVCDEKCPKESAETADPKGPPPSEATPLEASVTEADEDVEPFQGLALKTSTRDGGLSALVAISGALIGGAATIGASYVGRGSLGSSSSRGKCMWVGSAPFCYTMPHCPDEHWDFIRKYGGIYNKVSRRNGRYFGHGCWYGEKALCCKPREDDNSWDGSWERVKDDKHMACFVYQCNRNGRGKRSECGRCGLELVCTSNKGRYKDTWLIGGRHCKSLYKNGRVEGRGTIGNLSFWKGRMKGTWYKH